MTQSADISQLIHQMPEIVAPLSTVYDLQPDLIHTGTLQRVGPVTAGDTLTGRIEWIGTIALTIGRAA